MRDRVNDEKVGKKTLVVQIGGDKAKFYHTFLILGGIISLFIFLFVKGSMLSFIGLLPCLFFIVHLNKVMKIQNPVDFDPELKKVALSTFALAVLVSIFLNI